MPGMDFINYPVERRNGYAGGVMKTSLKSISSLVIALGFGAAVLSAQSTAASTHASNAVTLSGAASQETAAAAADSAAGAVRVGSAALAVPVWMSGAAVTGSGAVIASAGSTVASAGAAQTKAAERLWDFSTSDPQQRPALNRQRSVPAPAKPAVVTPAVDPTPAEAARKL
jgi:hypothetical protein